jgi:hypothetical protein
MSAAGRAAVKGGRRPVPSRGRNPVIRCGGPGVARPRKYTDDQLVTALRRAKGLIYHAAGRVGCDPDTFYDRARKSDRVAAAMRATRGEVIDTAESKLFRAIEKGEAWAVQFALRTIGRDRGYVERSEVHQSGGVTVVTEVVVRSREEAAALLPLSEGAGGPT